MILEHNEVAIGKCPVSFFPNPAAGHKGTLTLTNRRLLYEGAGDGIRSETKPDEDVHWSSDSSFAIDRRDIPRIEFDKENENQLCTVWLAESSLEFNFGTANIAKIRASLEGARLPKAPPASLLTRLFRVMACTLGLIVLSDIAGAVVTTIVDVLSSVFRNFGGMMIMYAIWFVLGAYTGLFIHDMGGGFASGSVAGSWSDRPGAAKTGLLVCSVALPIVIGLAYLALLFSWDSESVYVPGNTNLSVDYFAAITIGILGSQYMASSQSKSARQSSST